MEDAPPPPDAPDAAALARRNRRVLLATTLASLLVMGGLVALALAGGGAGSGGPTAAGAPGALPAGPRPPELPAGCVPDRGQPPRLVVDLPESGVDFGALKQGQVVEREVFFRNDGTGVLCLLDQGTPCGCVKLAYKDPTKRRYEPGERGSLVLTLTTEGHQGLQKKSFWLYTNELENARRTWPVTADIALGIVTSSGSLAFGSHRRGEAGSTVLRLTSPKADPDWEVASIEVSGPRVPGVEPVVLSFEAKPFADEAHKGFDLTVRHPGLPKEGLWQSPVLLKTTHPERREITLAAYFEAALPVKAWPSNVVFGFIVNGVMPTPKDVHLTPLSSDVHFRITGARLEPASGGAVGPDGTGFTCEVLQPPPDAAPARAPSPAGVQHPLVRVSYDGRLRRTGALEAVLVIGLDAPGLTELRVPVRATLTEKKSAPPPAPPQEH